MRTIVMASRKGGAGKTTLSCHLAVEAERQQSGPAALVDTDRMAGLAKWWGARKAATPVLMRAEPTLDDALEALRQLGTKYAIVDTPPAANALVDEAIQQADLIIVPVQPSPDDLRAVGETVELIEAAGKPMVFVINRVKPRVRLTNQAVIALSQHGRVAPVMIADRTSYAAAKVDGLVAQELDAEKAAAAEMDELWRYVAKLAGGQA